MNNEPTLMDIKTDKIYIHVVFVSVFFTLLLNIIFGSYIIYVAKLLHKIILPICLNDMPYKNAFTEGEKIPTTNNNININYLWSISQTQLEQNKKIVEARIARTKNIATNAPNDPAIDKLSTEQIPFKIDRELYYNKINIEGTDEPFDKDICSYVYKEKSVIMATIYLLCQHFYSFVYWGMCMFFSTVYGGHDAKSGVIWEFFMLLISPIYFIFFLIGWSVLTPLYVGFQLLINSWKISWNYLSGSDDDTIDTPNIRPLSEAEYAKYSWFKSIIYFITGWIFFIAILGILFWTVMLTISGMATLPAIILIIITFIRLVSYKTTIQKGQPGTKEPFVVLKSAITSKWEYLSYIITFIMAFYCHKIFGQITALIFVVLCIILVWSTSNAHTLLYYPYIPKENSYFIQSAKDTSPDIDKKTSCYDSAVCTQDNTVKIGINDKIKEIMKLGAVVPPADKLYDDGGKEGQGTGARTFKSASAPNGTIAVPVQVDNNPILINK